LGRALASELLRLRHSRVVMHFSMASGSCYRIIALLC
jgi:hypothetical protein